MSRYFIVAFVAFALLLTQTKFAPADAGEVDSNPVPRSPKASFFFIGGAATESTLEEFVKLAGGEKANIAIIAHASQEPADDSVQNTFASLGVEHTTLIVPGSKVGLPKDCNAIYFEGGDQARLKRLLDDPLLRQLETFEGLIGGSSAGSAIAPPMMIARGMDNGVVRAGELRLIPGLGFLPGCTVDTHVGARSRDTRSMAVLALMPEVKLAIALDEDTAVYIKDGKAHVYGKGHVRLFERGPRFSSNITTKKKGELANVKGAITSFLVEGDEFGMPALPAAGRAGSASGKTDGKSGSKADTKPKGDNKPAADSKPSSGRS